MKRISLIRYDKVRRKDVSVNNDSIIDKGEYITFQYFALGVDCMTPLGVMSEVTDIIMGDMDGDKYFQVIFSNGEEWVIFPEIQGLDIGHEKIEEDENN